MRLFLSLAKRKKTSPRVYQSLKHESAVKRHKNPYKHPEDPSLSLIKKIEIGILLVTLLSILVVTMYHPFFHITKIDVTGLQRIPESEFDDAIHSIMRYRHLFIFPGESYFFADTDEIRDILLEKFPIRSIFVQKTFPHTLSISLEEKISTLIYDNGKQYSYVGLDGHVVEIIRNVGEDEWKRERSITTTTLADGTIRSEEHIISETHIPPIRTLTSEMGDYPILYDKRKKAGALNDVVLKEETVGEAIAWFNHLNAHVGAPFRHMEIETELGDAIIYTQEGWYIKVKLNKNREDQFTSLDAVLSERGSREGLTYVDLRYGERVYWK